MNTFSTPLIRIALALVCLTLNVMFAGNLLTAPLARSQDSMNQYRRTLIENVAVRAAALPTPGLTDAIRRALVELVERNPDLIHSAALRLSDGTLLAAAGDHARYWVRTPSDGSILAYPQVPIFRSGARWGTLEVSFVADSGEIAAYLEHPILQFLGFVASAGFLVYLLFMRRALGLMDPSGVVPERVRVAFDALSEGILLMDAREQVVLANAAFMAKTGRTEADLRTMQPSQLPWRLEPGGSGCPWTTTLREGLRQNEVTMELASTGGDHVRFVVCTTPIMGPKGKVRGVLASFDDVTPLHETNTVLRKMVQDLESSKLEIARKNEDLLRLATRDPLTGCLNRRSFFEAAEAIFMDARMSGRQMCCIMADIDHFKSFNDRYGHATGDEVIKVVARTLAAGLRNSDLLCRYGGEEFCAILPNIGVDQATLVAERIRNDIETASGTALRGSWNIRITSSFGVSSVMGGVGDPSKLIDEADQALYVAKNSGRNRITRYDEIPFETVATTRAGERTVRA